MPKPKQRVRSKPSHSQQTTLKIVASNNRVRFVHFSPVDSSARQILGMQELREAWSQFRTLADQNGKSVSPESRGTDGKTQGT